MVRVYKKKKKHYTELTILKAIQEIEGGESINKIYSVSKDKNVTIESVIKSRGKLAVANHEPPKERKRVKMDGSMLTNESFKEQVEQFNKENLPKQRKFKKKKIVSDTDEDKEISLHDESDYDEDVEDSDTGCRRRHRLKGIHSKSDTSRTGAKGLSFYYPRLLNCLN